MNPKPEKQKLKPPSESQNSARPLQKMFVAVPPSYDFLNRLLTLRMDELWRKKAARLLLGNHPSRVLDLCTGTGDLAMHLQKMAGKNTRVTALDYSQPMLEVAEKKAGKRKLIGIEFIHGDAADLPFEDSCFDGVGIAFAFRNLTYKNPDTEKFLAEILRVLKPGGQFVAVETSQPRNRFMRSLFHAYLKYITSPVGGWLSGHKGAYHYLAHSAVNYYHPGELKEILMNAGFKKADYRLLFNGVAALWDCRK